MIPLATLENLSDRADEVVEKLQKERLVWVAGPSGSGRSTLANEIGAKTGKSAQVALHDLSSTDAPVHGLYQALSYVEDLETRQRLAVDQRDLKAAAVELGDLLAGAGTPLVLRVPPSWRLQERPTRATDYALFQRGSDLLHGWTKHPDLQVVIVTGQDVSGRDLGIEGTRYLPLQRPTANLAALEDEARWRSYSSAARGLLGVLDRKIKVSPIALRLAVGLAALDGHPRDAAHQLSEPGSTSTVQERLLARLASSISANSELCGPVACFLAARTAIRRDRLVALTKIPEDHEPLLSECIGYGEDRVRVSWSVRYKLASFLRKHLRDPGAHSALADHYGEEDGAPTLAEASGVRALAWLERAHHLAHSNRQDEWSNLQLPCREMYWDRGRYLSRVKKDYAAAADVYRACVQRFPTDDYSHHYLAFNLDQAGLNRDEVRREYQLAVTCNAEAEDNPWWNGRLVTSLIRQGLLFDAQTEWNLALDRVDPELTRAKSDKWLAEHFFYWVAAAWLEAGYPERARNVLELVSDRITNESESLSVLAHLVADAIEGAELRESVYDTSVEFSERWEKPRGLPDEHDGSRLCAWFPGRVLEVQGDDVQLVYASPEDRRARTRVFEREQWNAIAAKKDVEPDQFVELGRYEGGKELAVLAPPGHGPTQLPGQRRISQALVLAYLKRW